MTGGPPATLTENTLELPGRLRIKYVEQGDPTGVPLVLLHGITNSWHSYELVLPHLSPTIHAFALSQRGHGDSERTVSGYTPHEFAADVAAFLDEHGLARAVIVGMSMGGTVAQRFAIDYPDRAIGLVLISTFATFQDNLALPEFSDVVSKLSDPIDASFVRGFQESTLAQPIPPAFLDTVVAESLKVPARVWQAALTGLVNNELFGELGQITAPTLIMWGDQDAYVPRTDAEKLAAAITGARLVVYPGTGHALHWEEPAHFAADLTAFVESLVL
jgi:pimeloyl-ACP methyl ester carboxylesterase